MNEPRPFDLSRRMVLTSGAATVAIVSRPAWGGSTAKHPHTQEIVRGSDAGLTTMASDQRDYAEVKRSITELKGMTLPVIAELFDLSGNVALVTGGASGVGMASSLALAAAGATVIMADNADRIGRLDRSSLPAGIEALSLDVTAEQAVGTFVADVVARHGGIDILVNGAVLYHNKPLLEITGDEWDRVQTINLKSGFLMAKAVIPSMQARSGGRIINITTIGSVHPVLHGNAAYSSSRAGLTHLTRNLALDFAADGITANAILPGAIITEATPPKASVTGPGADSQRHIGGYGTAAELYGLVLLLAGPAGRYINGQAIAVDGGFLVS